MPGLIHLNQAERHEYDEYLADNPDLSIETVLNEIYDIHILHSPDDWKREDNVCLACWKEILSANCRDWWFSKKSSC